MKVQKYLTMESGVYRFAIELAMVDRLISGCIVEEFSRHPNYTVGRVQAETGELLALDLYRQGRPINESVVVIVLNVGDRQLACCADKVNPLISGTVLPLMVDGRENETPFFDSCLLDQEQVYYILDKDVLFENAPELSVPEVNPADIKRFSDVSFSNLIDVETPRGLAYTFSFLNKRRATGSLTMRSSDKSGKIGFLAGVPTYAAIDQRYGLEAISTITEIDWEHVDWNIDDQEQDVNIDSELSVIQRHLKTLS